MLDIIYIIYLDIILFIIAHEFIHNMTSLVRHRTCESLDGFYRLHLQLTIKDHIVTNLSFRTHTMSCDVYFRLSMTKRPTLSTSFFYAHITHTKRSYTGNLLDGELQKLFLLYFKIYRIAWLLDQVEEFIACSIQTVRFKKKNLYRSRYVYVVLLF